MAKDNQLFQAKAPAGLQPFSHGPARQGPLFWRSLKMFHRHRGSWENYERPKKWMPRRYIKKDGVWIECSIDQERDRLNGIPFAPEHRLIAERVLKRRLKKDEDVHHINGINTDNKNRNLLICYHWYHSWLEARIRSLRKSGNLLTFKE